MKLVEFFISLFCFTSFNNLCNGVYFTKYYLHYFQCLGQNSWWGARLLISLVEFQSRNILRLCALCEILVMPLTVLLIFT